MRAQASETSSSSLKEVSLHKRLPIKLPSHFGSAESESKCAACKIEKHPLYLCPKFKSMSHENKTKSARLIGCAPIALALDTSKAQCKSAHRCRVCHRPHHTLLHHDKPTTPDPRPPDLPSVTVGSTPAVTVEPTPIPTVGSTPAATGLCSNLLLMTCRVLLLAPDGSSVNVRALLDNASCTSFISERLAHSLCLHRRHISVNVSGIGGLSHKPPLQSVTTFKIQSSHGRRIEVTAVIVPRVTCKLPTVPVAFDLSWNHLNDLTLADPRFGQPGRVDILLGADIFVDVLRDGRRRGPTNAATAFETDLGWVLCGNAASAQVTTPARVASFHTTSESPDDILRRFWERRITIRQLKLVCEGTPCCLPLRVQPLTIQGSFIVPLPRDPSAGALGESRAQTVKRFMSLERSLSEQGRFED